MYLSPPSFISNTTTASTHIAGQDLPTSIPDSDIHFKLSSTLLAMDGPYLHKFISVSLVMDGFHIHQFFSLLLVILLWVPSGLCKDKSNGDSNNNQYDSQPSGNAQPNLPKQCSGGQNAWWQVLEFNQSDPCQQCLVTLAAPVIYNPITLQRLALPALKFQWKQIQMKPQ
ncbi:hypothetical protein M422DRAFT_263169 [Sphaerobolus stellatus SS14]|uniref:Uncharacterized protein n=1 Tax=Sphaerobolus stellatus (strain SS14) TaxID=990650 RepID=A0A0C9UZ85_SPHS4|nr:hypothetical protein M422DRAFT_263169 [Sphaerobolus stellatus SS14]